VLMCSSTTVARSKVITAITPVNDCAKNVRETLVWDKVSHGQRMCGTSNAFYELHTCYSLPT
jgi:hypothetical protein